MKTKLLITSLLAASTLHAADLIVDGDVQVGLNSTDSVDNAIYTPGNTAVTDISIVIGEGNNLYNTWDNGGWSAVFGRNNTIDTPFSAAFGAENELKTAFSQNYYHYAFGYMNDTRGMHAFTVGRYNWAYTYAFSGGYSNDAFADYSFVYGYDNTTSSSGQSSVAFGRENTVSSNYGATFGRFNNVSGDAAIAAGYNLSAAGHFSAATGENNIATGKNSAVFGYENDTKAYGSMTIGRFNDNPGGETSTSWAGTDPVFIIGTGADDLNRKNALVVYQDDKVEFNGEVTVTTAQGDIAMGAFQ